MKFTKIESKQKNVKFIFCSSPITIDKSKEWGGDNLQVAENVAWLKINENIVKTPAKHWRDSEENVIIEEVSHLVQHDDCRNCPVGWYKENLANRFSKLPIWVCKIKDQNQITIQTLDGPMTYKVDENSILCANDLNGEANMNDMWVSDEKTVSKNYFLTSIL